MNIFFPTLQLLAETAVQTSTAISSTDIEGAHPVRMLIIAASVFVVCGVTLIILNKKGFNIAK